MADRLDLLLQYPYHCDSRDVEGDTSKIGAIY